jgi:hypothetical protein
MGRQSTILNLLIAGFPFFLGIFMAFAATVLPITGRWVALGLSVVSFGLLLVLKLPALRAGQWLSFGPNQASGAGRWLWWFSFGLLVMAGAFAVLSFRTL